MERIVITEKLLQSADKTAKLIGELLNEIGETYYVEERLAKQILMTAHRAISALNSLNEI